MTDPKPQPPEEGTIRLEPPPICVECDHPEEAHGYARTVGCQFIEHDEEGPVICGCRKMRGELSHKNGDPRAYHGVPHLHPTGEPVPAPESETPTWLLCMACTHGWAWHEDSDYCRNGCSCKRFVPEAETARAEGFAEGLQQGKRECDAHWIAEAQEGFEGVRVWTPEDSHGFDDAAVFTLHEVWKRHPRVEAAIAQGKREGLERLEALLVNVAQVFDGWYADGTAWTEHDESVRAGVSEAIRSLQPPAEGGK